MPTKSLAIDSLELDPENPRITLATDQRYAMQKILRYAVYIPLFEQAGYSAAIR
jgi:hypothetical protein